MCSSYKILFRTHVHVHWAWVTPKVLEMSSYRAPKKLVTEMELQLLCYSRQWSKNRKHIYGSRHTVKERHRQHRRANDRDLFDCLVHKLTLASKSTTGISHRRFSSHYSPKWPQCCYFGLDDMRSRNAPAPTYFWRWFMPIPQSVRESPPLQPLKSYACHWSIIYLQVQGNVASTYLCCCMFPGLESLISMFNRRFCFSRSHVRDIPKLFPSGWILDKKLLAIFAINPSTINECLVP